MSTSKTRSSERLNANPKHPHPVTKTRSNPTVISKEEIIGLPSDVKDAQSGKTYLESNLLTPIDEPLDSALLSTTLLHITQLPNATRPIVEAIRAVAFILEEVHAEKIADSVAIRFLSAVSPKLTSLQTALDEMKHVTDTHKQSTIMTSDTLSQIRDATETLSTKINSNINTQRPPTPERTYSDALKVGTGNSIKVQEVLRRANVRARQILFTPTSDHALFNEKDTNDAVAQKLQSTIDSIRTDDDPSTSIKTVLLLHNGCILFEVNSPEAADWLRQADIKEKLITALGIPAEIRDRLYSIIVPYVPISFHLDDAATINNLEKENDIPQNSIASARWIKPKNKRAQGQKTAYAILSFSSPDQANTLIRDGLILNREKLHPRKDKKEPVRCVRCQKWGHIARVCKAKNDICGTCGNNHRTDVCNNSSNTFCVNCKQGNHTSHSRDCPEFAARCEQFDSNNPENQMPYYPTNASWTQALLPPKLATYFRQQPPARARHPTYRQTTFDIDKMLTTKPSTQRAQKDLRSTRTSETAIPVENGVPFPEAIPHSTPPRARSPPLPSRTPDDSFHSTSSNNEIDNMILNADTTNEL